MNIEPRLKRFYPDQRLTIDSVNSMIRRIEYAGNLITAYKPIAGSDVTIQQTEKGRIISSQLVAGKQIYIGISASTGAATNNYQVSDFTVDGVLATIDTTYLTNGSYLGGTLYQLTPNTPNQRGAIWSNSLINPAKFTASFSYIIGSPSSPGFEGDGICLIFSNAPFVAGVGGGLGYNGGNPLSVAVEIDTFKNPFDPNNSHIAILSKADVTIHLALASPTVRYSGTLSVNYASGILQVTHNSILILSYAIDIPTITQS